MAIYVWQYQKEYENEKEEVWQALEKVFKSGRLVLGESGKNFEAAFAAACGVKYGIGLNSATDALFLGLKAIGIEKGDEVITVSNTAVPTVSAIMATGATPVFVDIDPETYLMDTTRLESKVTKKTKCILPVHLFGQCVDMSAVGRIAEKHGLKVLEDCAQSTGAKQNGRISGSMSDLAAYSFYPTKILGTYGDGGMIVTNDEKIAAKLKRLRFYGMEQQYFSLEQGYNSRLDEIHAEILLRKLNHLDEYVARRRQLADQYQEQLAGTALKLPKVAEGNFHSYYIYVVRHPQRDRIIEELKKRDIHVNISYPWPIHIMPPCAQFGYKEGDLPHTEKAAKEIFSLPMYPTLTDEEQLMVSKALKEILKGLS
jgi:aminotransferase EvaB